MALRPESVDWYRPAGPARLPGRGGGRGLCCVVFLGLLFWLPTATTAELKVLLFGVVLLLVFLLAVMVAALKEIHVARSLVNGATIERWTKTHPGRAFH